MLYGWVLIKYIKGSNGSGQLGTGDLLDSSKMRKIDININVMLITGGGNHSVLMSNEGKLYSVGKNNHLQLCHNGVDSCIFMPTNYCNVINIACGWESTGIVLNSGNVHLFGAKSLNPRYESEFIEFKLQNIKFKNVSIGRTHLLLLTDDGKIYVWGIGKKGQLGLGQSNIIKYELTHVNIDTIVSEIKCGWEFNVILSMSNEIYTWGCNKYCQCAIEEQYSLYYPTKINLFIEEIICISTGWNHFIAITKSNKIYCFGRSDFGQLGIRKKNNIAFCLQLPLNSYSIATGAEHSLLFNHHLFTLYTFGFNEHGSCLNNQSHFTYSPFSLIIEHAQNKNIILASGYSHSFFYICQQ